MRMWSRIEAIMVVPPWCTQWAREHEPHDRDNNANASPFDFGNYCPGLTSKE